MTAETVKSFISANPKVLHQSLRLKFESINLPGESTSIFVKRISYLVFQRLEK